MYSSHKIDSVTCLHLSSRCTAAQSGSARRRWPCRLPLPAFAKSRASSTVSVTSSGNGQLSPDASNRRIVNRTVEGAVPTRRAISRLGIPADFNLITSRTWRIASLSVGIQVPLRKAERRDRSGARRGRVTLGDIIPEWWARSSRNGGRHHIGTVGEIIPESRATSSGISTLGIFWSFANRCLSVSLIHGPKRTTPPAGLYAWRRWHYPDSAIPRRLGISVSIRFGCARTGRGRFGQSSGPDA